MTQLLAMLLMLMVFATNAFAQKSQAIIYDDFILHNGRTTTSNGAFVSVDTSNTIGLDVSISGTATVDFKISGAGRIGWNALQCFPSDADTGVTTTTASGFYQCNVAGADVVSAQISACTACTVTVIARRTTAVLGGGGGGGSVSEADTLETVTGRGRVVTTANSLLNAVRIGDGTTPMCHYTDVTLGPMIRPCTDSNVRTLVPANFTWCWYDLEGNACMFTIDPDAASVNLMYQYQTGYKPIASFMPNLEPRGAATSASESITTNVPKAWYLTVTDADTDAADFSFPVTAKMAGATTMTFRLYGVSNNASPSGNIAFDCAVDKFTPGTNTLTAHSTTGQQRITLTPATQYRMVAGTSAAHTINGGALATGDIVFGSCEVDATATTSAQMTNFRLWGNVLIQLSVNSPSD